MKRLISALLISILLPLTLFAFAYYEDFGKIEQQSQDVGKMEEYAKDVGKIEEDLQGELNTYYLLKAVTTGYKSMEENVKDLVKKITGIEYSSDLPNANTMVSQMVSLEYIEKNCPLYYEKVQDLIKGKEKFLNVYGRSGYGYCFFSTMADTDTGIFYIVKQHNNDLYVSISIYFNEKEKYSEKYEWYYTKDSLKMLEESLAGTNKGKRIKKLIP